MGRAWAAAWVCCNLALDLTSLRSQQTVLVRLRSLWGPRGWPGRVCTAVAWARLPGRRRAEPGCGQQVQLAVCAGQEHPRRSLSVPSVPWRRVQAPGASQTEGHAPCTTHLQRRDTASQDPVPTRTPGSGMRGACPPGCRPAAFPSCHPSWAQDCLSPSKSGRNCPLDSRFSSQGRVCTTSGARRSPHFDELNEFDSSGWPEIGLTDQEPTVLLARHLVTQLLRTHQGWDLRGRETSPDSRLSAATAV